MRRFSIGKMMAVVVLIALVFAALRSPSRFLASVVFTVTCLILIVATVCAASRDRPQRYFWLGFAAFGWGHQVLAFLPMIGTDNAPILVTTYLLFYSSKLIVDFRGFDFPGFARKFVYDGSVTGYSPFWIRWERGQIILSVLSLVIASFAGLLSQQVFVGRFSKAISPADRGRR